MNLHEFQSKKLFADYGLPVPKGIPCRSVSETGDAFDSLGGSRAVVKCQVYAGGRGKSGGVKVVSSRQEAEEFAGKWLGNRLVTYQTGKHGQPVSAILVEECSEVVKELYLGAVIDRSRRRVVFMASTEGGTEIEKVARETPDRIFKEVIEPLTGPQPFQGRELGFKLGLNPDQIKEFTSIFLKLGKMFEEKDLSLLEINPLVIGADGHLVCLDAKINIDSNALFRHKDLAALIDWSQSEPAEARASQVGLNYVALDGNMAARSYRIETGDGVKVIKDTAGCVLAFLMLPQAEYMNRHKMLEMNTGWNIHCMSHVDEALAKFMFNYYMYTFIVIFCTMSIIYLIVSRKYRKSVGRLSCFAGMSVLLALWFGLGDGAPVNDRYALIVLVTWGMMWMLVLLRILPRRKGKGLI